jgi:hypothetical protein
MRVHSMLPARHDERLTRALGEIDHVPQSTPEAAMGDSGCVAFVGPWRSVEVAEAMEGLGPHGLAHLAPAATWVGLTRPDEPAGSDDKPERRTLFRLAARDMEVCRAIVSVVDGRARLISDGSEYGSQIASQLRLAGLESDGDMVVYAGLGETAPPGLPPNVIALDGAAHGGFPERHPEALYFCAAHPVEGFTDAEAWDFAPQVEQAGRLIASGALPAGFDEHGDPLEPVIGMWRFSGGEPVSLRTL